MKAIRETPVVSSANRRLKRMLAVSCALLCAGLIFSICGGKEFINPLTVLFGSGLDNPARHDILRAILLNLRLPRAIGAGLIGLSLATSGLLLQTYFRNPLADPFILGVSSGAALGAVAKILFFSGLPVPTAVFALAGAAALVTAVWAIARAARGDQTISLLLSGVALSMLAGSLMSVVVIWARPGDLGLVMRWLFGTLSGVGWDEVLWLFPVALAGLLVAIFFARELNALLLGPTVAASVGVDVRAARLWIIGAATTLAAVSVAAAGIVGFVGLVVPHICRLIVGGDARRLVPASAIAGAGAMLWADALSRTALMSGELPVGAITAMLGVPFFLWLLVRGRFIG